MREWIKTSRCAVFVLHFNHAAEIDDQVEIALERLRSAGAVLLNQSVLLRESMTTWRPYALCLRLVVCKCCHTTCINSIRCGACICSRRPSRLNWRQLRRHLPGYAVLYWCELAGQPHKTPLG